MANEKTERVGSEKTLVNKTKTTNSRTRSSSTGSLFASSTTTPKTNKRSPLVSRVAEIAAPPPSPKMRKHSVEEPKPVALTVSEVEDGTSDSLKETMDLSHELLAGMDDKIIEAFHMRQAEFKKRISGEESEVSEALGKKTIHPIISSAYQEQKEILEALKKSMDRLKPSLFALQKYKENVQSGIDNINASLTGSMEGPDDFPEQFSTVKTNAQNRFQTPRVGLDDVNDKLSAVNALFEKLDTKKAQTQHLTKELEKKMANVDAVSQNLTSNIPNGFEEDLPIFDEETKKRLSEEQARVKKALEEENILDFVKTAYEAEQDTINKLVQQTEKVVSYQFAIGMYLGAIESKAKEIKDKLGSSDITPDQLKEEIEQFEREMKKMLDIGSLISDFNQTKAEIKTLFDTLDSDKAQTQHLTKELEKKMANVDAVSQNLASNIPNGFEEDLSIFDEETKKRLNEEQARVKTALEEENILDFVKTAYKAEQDTINKLVQQTGKVVSYQFAIGKYREAIESKGKEIKDKLGSSNITPKQLEEMLEQFEQEMEKVLDIKSLVSDFNQTKAKIKTLTETLEKDKVNTSEKLEAEKSELVRKAELAISKLDQVVGSFKYKPNADILKDTECKTRIVQALSKVSDEKRLAKSKADALNGSPDRVELNRKRVVQIEESYAEISKRFADAKNIRNKFLSIKQIELGSALSVLKQVEEFEKDLEQKATALEIIANQETLTLEQVQKARTIVNDMAVLLSNSDNLKKHQQSIESAILAQNQVRQAKDAFVMGSDKDSEALKILKKKEDNLSDTILKAKNVIGMANTQQNANLVKKIQKKCSVNQNVSESLGKLIGKCNEYSFAASKNKNEQAIQNKIVKIENIKAIAEGQKVFNSSGALIDVNSVEDYKRVPLTDAEKLQMATDYWQKSNAKKSIQSNTLASWEKPIIGAISAILGVTVVGLIFGAKAASSYVETGSLGFWRNATENKLSSGKAGQELDLILTPSVA